MGNKKTSGSNILSKALQSTARSNLFDAATTRTSVLSTSLLPTREPAVLQPRNRSPTSSKTGFRRWLLKSSHDAKRAVKAPFS